jgi:RNA polymerase-binding transcription factor DksA
VTDTAHSTRLTEERQTTVNRLEGLRREFGQVVEASVDSNADDEHDPEGATIAYERSQVAALIDQAEQHLSEIDAAEARLAEGTYGRCVVCGRPIPDERLEARPTARTCIDHAGAAQHG